MSQRPPWLPDKISTDGRWEEIVDELYRIFAGDFKNNTIFYKGYPVWWDRRILEDDKEEGFWHLITKKDTQTGQRLFDPRRAERLRWCRALIENDDNEWIRCWDYQESKGRIRTYLWIEKLDYVVVLEKRKVGKTEGYFLITAFYVDGESKRRNLRRKYEKRLP